MTTCLNCGHEEAEFLFCPRCGTQAPEAGETNSLIGRTLSDKYRVVTEIGSGAMGTVYLGEHVGLKKKIALKVLHPDLRLSDEQLQRFQREGIAAGKFSHPNAIQIFDFDKSEGAIYLAMEFVEGSNLRVYLRRKGRLQVAVAVQLTRQVLACLTEAHKHGIVHRDLKPDNIMIVPGSRGEVRVKVLDFGLSKLAALGGNEQSSLVTQAGRILGTPLYMSPEQCAGEETDARSDLYAVGLILYEMVAGLRPFHEESTTELLFTRSTQEAPSLLGEFPELEIPAELDELITRSLSRRRRDRFQTAEEMMFALEAVPLDAKSWSSGGTTIMTSRSAVAAERQSRAASAEAEAGAPNKGIPRVVWIGGGLLAFAAAFVVVLTMLLGGDTFGGSSAVRVSDIPADERNVVQDQYVRLLDLARTALRSGNSNGAFTTVGEALQSEAVDSEAYLVQAEVFRALGDEDAALVSYRDALREDPEYVAALLGIGWLHLERDEQEDARTRFEAAGALEPDSPEVRTGLGVVAYRIGDRNGAAEAFDAALAVDPRSPLALLYRGRLQLDSGETEAAVETLVQAKLADPSSRAHAWLAEAYLEVGREEDAESQWRAALDVEDTVAVRRDLGALLLAGERYSEAERFLSEASRRFDDDPELAVLYAAALHGRGSTSEAVRVLEEARRLGASDPESMALLGLLYHASGRVDEALGQYEAVLEDYGDVPRANLGKGMILFERSDYAGAREAFQRVLEYDDSSEAAYFHLGLLAMDYFGETQTARAHFERYLDLGGADPRVRGWLGRLR